ncbi:initiation factor 2B [Oscillochloris sp. ZM17-4]|uniref:translation initiation factor eIF-2B n=1 Tax=Oscillochloris sp. ZM17-4 TaxID=2866714 RepID=UPI001C736748|nr:initiation factor 2B [Oscillochloris sp. ZM17-4]
MDGYIAQAITAITEDGVSGAVEIAEKSADLFIWQASADTSGDLVHLRKDLLDVGWTMIRAHPTMAPLVNLVNALLWKIESARDFAHGQQVIEASANEFKRRLHVHEAAIAETALRLISDDAQIVTNGRSTTVRAVLRHAQRAGRRFRVICAEGRPACEGRIMASELAASGITTTLVVDALAVVLAGQSQLVLVGADHLSAHGLMNKVGTYGMVLSANAADVPAYALCSSEKFLPPEYHPPQQARWPAEQVWPEVPENIQVANVYFDTTPLSALAGIVTEQGVQPTVGIEAWLAAIQLNPALRL